MAKIDRYHISKRGKPTVCRAKTGNCPLGGETAHYSSKEEAQKAVEKQYSESYNILSSIENWNPESAKKEVSNSIKNIYDAVIFDRKDVNTTMKELQNTVKKYEGLPETLIDLQKRFVNSKPYLDYSNRASKPDATPEDKENYHQLQQAALSIIQPVSKNMNKPNEFNGATVGVFGARLKDSPEKGSKEWFKKKHQTLSPDEVAIIYKSKYTKDKEAQEEYDKMIKEKSTYYTDNDYQKMSDEYMSQENNTLDNKEIMSPLIVQDFITRESPKKDTILKESRYFQNDKKTWETVKIEAIYSDDGDFDDEDIEYENTGALITTVDKKWGRKLPVEERVKALYTANTLGVDEITIINRENLNEDNEYTIREDDYIDPDAKEPIDYNDFSGEIKHIMEETSKKREENKKNKENM